MIRDKITKGGIFIKGEDEQGNPIVKFKQKTTTLRYDMLLRIWKIASETTKLISIGEFSPKFCKKISFNMIWKRKIGIGKETPFGLGIREYEYLVRKITISVKADFWSVYLYCEQFGVLKKRMSNVIMRDFFNFHGYGTEIVQYSKNPAGHPLRVREGKWKLITEEKATEIYSSGRALLVGKIKELPDGTTTYSFGETL